MKKTIFVILAFAALLFVSCSSFNVVRLSEDDQLELSGYWNDTDIQIVSQGLIEDCINSNALRAYRNKATKPVVIVGLIMNNSSEHIDTAIISKKMEVALVNSGLVTTVADYALRDQILDERTHQQYYASEETAALLGNETGADFMLQGSVRTNLDQVMGKAVRTYYVSLELVDIETSAKVWLGEETVKKYIKKAQYTY